MKISIVIATFNAGRYLSACLDSCISQTWRDKEIIVIDGGSTDQTVDIIRRYSGSIAFWLSEPDRGIYDAWNKALPHVTGSWVLFRGADDLFWDENTLERCTVGLSSASPSELVCCGAVVSVNDKNQMVGIRGYPWDEAKKRFFKEMSITHSGVFHHIDLFCRFGNFDTSYRIAGDYDFLLRALRTKGVEAKLLTGVIVTKMSGSGISNTRKLLTKRESIRALRSNGISGVPITQYRQLATIIFETFRRKALQLLLNSNAYEHLRQTRRDRMEQQVRGQVQSMLENR